MPATLALTPLSVQPDARLVQLAREGSERAFEALVRRYRRPLLAYARRLVGPDGRAEDALQQSLIGAWLALRDGAEVDEVRPWLHRIVHNCAVSMLRRAQHETVELNEALDAACDGDPDSRLALRELLAGVAALPEPQRRALVLTAIGGRSHVEAAATLGLTDGAVRGLIYRARATLRSAAAALLPIGPLNWLIGAATRRPWVADTAEAGGAAGSAGVAAAVLKGSAIVATAGAIAGAAPVLGPGAASHHHTLHRPPAPQVVHRAPVHPPRTAARVIVVHRLVGAGAATPRSGSARVPESRRTRRGGPSASEGGSRHGSESSRGSDSSGGHSSGDPGSGGHSNGGPGRTGGDGSGAYSGGPVTPATDTGATTDGSGGGSSGSSGGGSSGSSGGSQDTRTSDGGSDTTTTTGATDAGSDGGDQPAGGPPASGDG